MRVKPSRYLFGAIVLASLLQTGCGLTKQLGSNLIADPLHWDRFSDACGRHLRDKHLADEAWDEICTRDGDIYSRHYRRGFYDGFRDYMDMGGTGDPPTTPPRTYWRLYYQNPEGHEAIQDWFNGFRHGSSVARASGLRDYVTVPVSSVPPREILTDEAPPGEPEAIAKPATPPAKSPEKTPGTDKEGPVKPPVTPPKTASGKPMPPPAPPIIQVERMIAPPVPNRSNPPR